MHVSSYHRKKYEDSAGPDVLTLVSPVCIVRALDRDAVAVGEWFRRQWDVLEESQVSELTKWCLKLSSGIFELHYLGQA